MLDKVFIQVLDMSKTASLVVLVVILARVFLKRAPKVFSYALWGIVLFRLLCPITIEVPVSVLPKMPSVGQGYTLSEEAISVLGAAEAAYQAVGDALNGGLGIQHIRTTEKTESGMTYYVTSDWWSVWILFGQYVWVVGMVVMLLRSVVSYGKLRKQTEVSIHIRDNIYWADDVQTPFVMGLFRPRIYLPGNLQDKEQGYIILHEQHHIKRGDTLWKMLAFAALTLHWFNPLVWLAFVLAGKDMEMSCDEAVLRTMGSEVRADYAASLLKLATGHKVFSGAPLAFGEGDTKTRIYNLSKWKKPVIGVVIAGVVICVILGICLLTNPRTNEPTMENEEMQQAIEQAVVHGEIVTGITYVPYQCLYMNPLSSYAAMGGDSGCKYVIGEDSFVIIQRGGAVMIDENGEPVEAEPHVIEVSKWEWKEFPYTDEEWASFYTFEGMGIPNISEIYDEMLYQPLQDGLFLLKMDEQLWLVDLKSNPKMGTYLWSIYRLVPEDVMGMAQWEYKPIKSSGVPFFKFDFDVEDTVISAVCVESLLVDFDAPEKAKDVGLTFENGNAMYWSPLDKDGEEVDRAVIHFTINQGNKTYHAGTIYITSEGDSEEGKIYTASLVGTGLHLQDSEKGGIITFVSQ